MSNREFKLKVQKFIQEELADSEVFTSEMFCGDWNSEYHRYDSEETEKVKDEMKAADLSFELQEQFGGEGMGDDYWSVYSVTDGTNLVYIKLQGWYQSYNGSEYNEWFFVEPKQVMVTQYEKV